MDAEVIRLGFEGFPNLSALSGRLDNIAALFRAVHAGELLSALPDCPIAREHHRTALTLLSLAESEILALQTELRNT